MATIRSEIITSGKCLMDGKESTVTLFPSQEKGIKFYSNNEKIEAKAENVISTMNCVVLGNKKIQIKLVEHFMAACAFARIDSLDVCLEGSEIPIMDGSAKDWYELFINAGTTKADSSCVEFKEPVTYAEGNTIISLIPADKLTVSYLVNFEHPDLKNRWINWNFDNDNNNKEIIEARTFGYLKDLEKFQKAGFALGASIDNTIGLTEDGYTVSLRSDVEPIKHKVLDIIGDLYLSGLNPLDFKAHIIAKEAGHRSHVGFARLLKEKI